LLNTVSAIGKPNFAAPSALPIPLKIQALSFFAEKLAVENVQAAIEFFKGPLNFSTLPQGLPRLGVKLRTEGW
jgi:hypothetical protein